MAIRLRLLHQELLAAIDFLTSFSTFRSILKIEQLKRSRNYEYANLSDVLVLGIPCCGVPVAFEVVCLNAPSQFNGIGLWYEDFDRTTDDEVCELLNVATYKFYSSIW